RRTHLSALRQSSSCGGRPLFDMPSCAWRGEAMNHAISLRRARLTQRQGRGLTQSGLSCVKHTQASCQRHPKAGSPSLPEPPPDAPPRSAMPAEPSPDPRDLLDEANGASVPASSAWIAFLLLLAYVVVTLAGVSHKNLLLNSPVKLPIINADIPLVGFFQYAPV